MVQRKKHTKTQHCSIRPVYRFGVQMGGDGLPSDDTGAGQGVCAIYSNADPKIKSFRSKPYLKFLLTQPCLKCGAVKTDYLDIVPAHQDFGLGGTSIKSPDIYAIPLCNTCHTVFEHQMGIKTLWPDERDRLVLGIRCLEYINRFLALGGKLYENRNHKTS